MITGKSGYQIMTMYSSFLSSSTIAIYGWQSSDSCVFFYPALHIQTVIDGRSLRIAVNWVASTGIREHPPMIATKMPDDTPSPCAPNKGVK